MKNEQPVLVILTPGFPANEADTACLTSQQNLVRSINKARPDLQLIILSFQYPFEAQHYNWHGNTVISFNGQNKGKLHRLLVWKKVWQQLKRTHKENKIIGLLSFWCGECALVGKHFGSRFHLPHYCWILGQDARTSNHYVAYARLSGEQLVALSDFLRDEFCRNHGIMPAHVIPNGVESDAFRADHPVRSIDLLGVGSLIPLKQYDIFVGLVSRLREKFPNIKTVICGKGPEEEKLRSMIHHLGLEENITLTGELPHADILRLMQQSSILVHPSSYEGFSTVCLEALYAGAEVISFCKPMKADIRNWWTVATPEAMQEAIASILLESDVDDLPVMPYSIDATALAFLELFNQQIALPATPGLHKHQKKGYY